MLIPVSWTLQQRIDKIRKLFPELENAPVEFARDKIDHLAHVRHYRKKHIVVFDLRCRRPSNNTIGHELCHVVSEEAYRNGDMTICTGERANDIMAMARSIILCDEEPSYIDFAWSPRIVTKKWVLMKHICHQIAKEALDHKSKGIVNYLKWAIHEMSRRCVVLFQENKIVNPNLLLPVRLKISTDPPWDWLES